MWHVYRMEYYSAIKKNEFESVLLRWMNLEPVILTFRSKSERENKYSILTYIYIWNLENGIDEPICKEGMRCRYREWTCRHSWGGRECDKWRN